MSSGVTLRPIDPDDGPKIATLGEQTPDTGAVAFRNEWHYDPYASIMALHQNAIGVVAEAPDHDGIVGMGMMSMGECQYEGSLRPFAYLFSLSVHPEYRRRGIASQIAAWRVDTARTRLGSDAVIFAGIQQGNEGSLRNAAKWSSQRFDERSVLGVVNVRSSAPALQRNLEVRPAEAHEYAEIAEKQNALYADHNLYPPRTAEDMQMWHGVNPFGFPVREYYVVVDSQRNIVGGLSATEEGKVTSGNVVRMPLPLRMINVFAKLIPADGVTKRIHVKDMWFAPDRLDAGRYLWESLRWLWRARGTTMMSFFDPQSPLAQIPKMPWYMPRQGGGIVAVGPVPMQTDKPLYMHV